MEKISQPFWDRWGTLDKKYMSDGGDSCHRIGMYYGLLGILPLEDRVKYFNSGLRDFNIAFSKHHVAPGVFVRHPNLDWDASDWDRMSRDQFQPMIMAAGYWSRQELKKITIGHLKRAFLFTNNVRQNGANKRSHGTAHYDYGWRFPDVTLFEIWGTFIRAWNAWWLYPLLLIFDLETLGGSIKWRFWPKHNITLNHTLALLHQMDRLPTPWTWLSGKIMPPERLIKLMGEHFRDFGEGNDMVFFEEMCHEVLNEIR